MDYPKLIETETYEEYVAKILSQKLRFVLDEYGLNEELKEMISYITENSTEALTKAFVLLGNYLINNSIT